MNNDMNGHEGELIGLTDKELYHALIEVARDFYFDNQILTTEPPVAYREVFKKFNLNYDILNETGQQAVKNLIVNRWYSSSPFYADYIKYNDKTHVISITSKGIAFLEKTSYHQFHEPVHRWAP